ncbi:MAG: mechanosensitive ion channel family protein [Chloroflexota bacterium]
MLNGLWISIWRVGIVTLVGIGSAILLHLSLRSIEKRLKDSSVSGERLKRLTTLVRGWRSIGHILILLIMALMILHELGINITPVLASAGVIGLAFSLGAQTVIKDFLGGVVILTENQFTIGDVVTVGTLTGTVEHITLRATYLRDMEGKLHLIPNGDIRTVSNLTTQWAQVVVTFNFDYETDMERAVRVLEESTRQIQSDRELTAALLEAPQVFGWSGFTDWAVQAQIIAKTHPGQQWLVARKVRQSALAHLQTEGIRLAVPRQRVENLS